MARPAYGGRATCEACKSIDVRRWHREGRLRPGLMFVLSWTRGGEPSGSITVRTELDAVILSSQVFERGGDQWEAIEQRVPITWTPCNRRTAPVVHLFGCTRAAGTAVAALRCCMEAVNCSPAADVTASRMKANRNRL